MRIEFRFPGMLTLFLWVMSLIMFTLKLMGYTDISWWVVFGPFWIPPLIGVVFISSGLWMLGKLGRFYAEKNRACV